MAGRALPRPVSRTKNGPRRSGSRRGLVRVGLEGLPTRPSRAPGRRAVAESIRKPEGAGEVSGRTHDPSLAARSPAVNPGHPTRTTPNAPPLTRTGGAGEEFGPEGWTGPGLAGSLRSSTPRSAPSKGSKPWSFGSREAAMSTGPSSSGRVRSWSGSHPDSDRRSGGGPYCPDLFYVEEDLEAMTHALSETCSSHKSQGRPDASEPGGGLPPLQPPTS